MLKQQNPYQQVAGQVYFTNQAIEQGLNQINNKNWLEVKYEDLCNDPSMIYKAISEKLTLNGFSLNDPYSGPQRFSSTNKTKIEKEKFELIAKSYEDFAR